MCVCAQNGLLLLPFDAPPFHVHLCFLKKQEAVGGCAELACKDGERRHISPAYVEAVLEFCAAVSWQL